MPAQSDLDMLLARNKLVWQARFIQSLLNIRVYPAHGITGGIGSGIQCVGLMALRIGSRSNTFL